MLVTDGEDLRVILRRRHRWVHAARYHTTMPEAFIRRVASPANKMLGGLNSEVIDELVAFAFPKEMKGILAVVTASNALRRVKKVCRYLPLPGPACTTLNDHQCRILIVFASVLESFEVLL